MAIPAPRPRKRAVYVLTHRDVVGLEWMRQKDHNGRVVRDAQSFRGVDWRNAILYILPRWDRHMPTSDSQKVRGMIELAKTVGAEIVFVGE